MDPLEKLSDEELQQLAKGGMESLSDEALMKIAGPQKPERGVISTILEPLNYPSRVARTAIGAALSPEIEMKDVAEQASHLYPENAKNEAPSGKDLNQLLNQFKLPPLGVNPNFKGPEAQPVGLYDAIMGKVTPKSEGAHEVAGLITEGVTDPLMYEAGTKALALPFRGAGAVIKGIGGAGVKGAEVALEAATKGAGKLLKGAKGEGAVGSYSRGLGRAILDTVERTKPALNPELDRLTNIAKSIGISPNELSDGIRFGKQSDVNNITRVLGEMPGGEPIKKSHEALRQKILGGLDERVQGLSNNRVAAIENHIQAGEQLSKDFDKAQNALRNKVDFDRGFVYKDNPEFQLSQKRYEEALGGVDKYAQKAASLSETAIDPTVAQQASKASQVVVKLFENLSTTAKAADYHRALQQLGDVAFNGSRMAPEVKNILKDAYFDLAKVYDGNVKDLLGPDVAKSIDESNKIWTEWYGSSKDFEKSLASGDDPEKIYNRLIKHSGSGELQKYRNFMMKNNPEGLQNMKSLLMNEFLNGASGKNGLNFETFLQSLDNPKISGRLQMLYTPEELTQIKEVAELGSQHGESVFNTSKTEVTGGFKKFVKETNKKAQLEALRESLIKRAMSPEGLPIDAVKSGNTMIPGLEEKALKTGVSKEERFPLMKAIQTGNAIQRRRERQ
jgi:hypothetical protein